MNTDDRTTQRASKRCWHREPLIPSRSSRCHTGRLATHFAAAGVGDFVEHKVIERPEVKCRISSKRRQLGVDALDQADFARIAVTAISSAAAPKRAISRTNASLESCDLGYDCAAWALARAARRDSSFVSSNELRRIVPPVPRSSAMTFSAMI